MSQFLKLAFKLFVCCCSCDVDVVGGVGGLCFSGCEIGCDNVFFVGVKVSRSPMASVNAFFVVNTESVFDRCGSFDVIKSVGS